MHLPIISAQEPEVRLAVAKGRPRVENVFTDFWRDGRMEKYLRHGTETVLAVLIILLIASFWWPHARKIPVTAAISAAELPIPTSVDLSRTPVAAHLFGQAQSSTPNTAVATSSITVDGIVYTGRPSGSQALLTINGKTDVYKVGDTLPDGEKLTAIEPSDVLLAGNGATRRAGMADYGTAGSEGRAAYAAMLAGTGFATFAANTASARDFGTASEPSVPAFIPVLPVALHAIVVPHATAVRLPVAATPLEQLRTLRAQLIR